MSASSIAPAARATAPVAAVRPFGTRTPRCRLVARIRCHASHNQHHPLQSDGSPTPEQATRRAALGLLAAGPAAAAAALLAAPLPAFAEPAAADLLGPSSSSSSPAAVDTTPTHRIFLDMGLCPEAVRTDRTLGDKTPFCNNPEPMGRIVIDLYGRAAPGSVANIVAAVQAGAYNSTSLTKIIPGRYLLAGVQGGKRSGLVQQPQGLPSNQDLLNSAAFRLTHRRPGTVSLNLSENEDDNYFRSTPGYRNLSLLITTGPGPVPDLDDENIVVGQVVEGLDVVASITQVPTFTPNDNSRAFNQFASFIGDDRADKTRAKWGRPLQAVVITQAGVL